MNEKSFLTSGRGLTKRYCRPRPIGDIINEMLRSDSPLAKGYRKLVASKETLFGPEDSHFTFRETQPSSAGKRNTHVFVGKFITITRRDDGSLRPNFKPLKVDKRFSIISYATGVANELLWALTSLLGK